MLINRKIFIVIVILISAFVFSNISTENSLGEINGGLEAYYPFNGNAEDATGNGHDGTPVGGVSWSNEGIKDGCLSVSSGHIQIGDRYNDGVMNYDADQDFTWALWFKPSGPNNDDEMLLSRRRYHGSGDQVSMHVSYYSNGRIRMLFGADMDPATLGWSTTRCNEGEWHHVAIVRHTQSSKMLMYIDGNLEDEQHDYGSDYSAASSCRIGQEGETYGGNRQYHGLIDDVRIYSYALTPNEISKLYSPVITVSIDIKPGSDLNSINIRSKGVIAVAILTTDDFDATTVDPLSVKFGPGEAVECHGKGHIEDIDGDGDLDMVLHFKTQETGIQNGDTEACLSGETIDGEAIEGSDAIVTSGKTNKAPSRIQNKITSAWGKLKSK